MRAEPFDPELLLAHDKRYIPETAPTVTSVLRAVLPFDEAITIHTKQHKWKKIVRAGWKGVYFPEPLFYYRMHEHNKSGIGKKVSNNSSDARFADLWNSNL